MYATGRPFPTDCDLETAAMVSLHPSVVCTSGFIQSGFCSNDSVFNHY